MAAIAALMPSPTDRDFLTAAASPRMVLWADSWRELQRVVRKNPVSLVVMDLHAETRKDGALRVFRFVQRFPLTPLVVWADADGRELFRLGKAGAADVVISRDADDPVLVREILDRALARGLWPALESKLSARVDREGVELLRHAAHHIADQVQVPELAEAFEVSISTLERRCERWLIPTPGRLLLWLRVLHGLRWLMEPGRSVESVGHQLGYSSGAAFRRAIKATVGSRGASLRGMDGLERALDMFVSECGREPAGMESTV
jgi:AraC-like DNA-binding protein